MSEYIVDLAEGYANTVLDTKEKIVRCEDCKFRGRCTEIEEGMTRIMFLDCSLAPDNGFCAWGERRDNV